ncbi:MAG: ASKHA domain-containing protein, partial [Pseudomonadota bacterium]
NTSDLSRLLLALKKQHSLKSISIDFLLLKKLSKIIRDANWSVTAVIAQTRMESQPEEHQIRVSRRPKLMSVQPGDTTDKHYAIVFDIGTTTLWGRLIDLNSKQPLAVASEYNPQIQFGDDVITRIVFSQKGDGLKKIHEVVIAGLNRIIGELLHKTGVDRRHVCLITAAGNTTMAHLLLGLDPKYIREAPYTPVANFFPPLRALRIGLEVEDYVYLYVFPVVASYVGGDIVSGVLSSGMYQRSELTLYIDIGTNGEIVVGNADWLMTASCSAGPAFEGGGLKFGMRATTGAIERYRISPVTYEPVAIMTVGKAKPKGICGSGAINILAEFLKKGVLAQNGKYNTRPTQRIRQGDDGMEYVLAYKEETDGQEDIVLTESDIDNLIRAKAAMFAGYQCLLDKVGLTFSQLERVIIAGAFGDFIDLDEAMAIGLLPEMPTEKYMFIGNGSLLGAQLTALSNELLDDGELIARKMTNIELSEDRSFMDKYMAGMFLPHTDGSLFPGVMAQLASLT